MPFVIPQHSGSAGALLCCHPWCHGLCCQCPLVHAVALSRMQGDAMGIGSLSPAAIYLYWIIFPLFVLLRPPVSRLVAVLWLRLVSHSLTHFLIACCATFKIEHLLFNRTHTLTHSHTHALTYSLSLIIVAMMRSNELKTSRSILMLQILTHSLHATMLYNDLQSRPNSIWPSVPSGVSLSWQRIYLPHTCLLCFTRTL